MKRISAMPLLFHRGLVARRRTYPFPLGCDGVTLWYNARAAIWQGTRALGLQVGDRVLVPAYSCGSEVDALLKAGLVLDYYRILPDLSPDMDHVASLCQEHARALYITHYFGFAQPMDGILDFTRENGLFLIEDTAHGLFSLDEEGRPLGSRGDMGVFSLGKSMPLPDGGALVTRPGRAPHSAGRRPRAVPVAGKIKYLIEESMTHACPRVMGVVKTRVSDPLTRLLKAGLYGTTQAAGTMDLSEAEMRHIELLPERADWSMSGSARLFLRTACGNHIPERRRRNYLAIRSLLAEGRRVMPLLGDLRPGCCPLFFPVRACDAEDLSRFLAANGVGFFRFWSRCHKAMPLEKFSLETALKSEVVALPIHQDLDEEDMAYIAGLLNRWSRTP